MELNLLNNETVSTADKTQTHVSFKECFPNGWREYFRKEDTLLKVLEAAGLTSTHDFVQVNSRYLIDDNRVAIILLVKRKGTEIMDKVIVDVISSHLKFEQLMDVFYNVGANCDYRIVLYDENTRFEDYTGHPIIGFIMTSLMDYLRGHVSFTSMGIDLEVPEPNVVNFQCRNIESISKDSKYCKLPDRRIFEEAEFWGPYFVPLHFDNSCTEYCFGDNFHDDDSNYFKSIAKWGDEGMSLEIEVDDAFKWLLIKKLSDVEHIFKDCSIDYSINEQNTFIKKNIQIRNILSIMPEKNENSFNLSRLTISRAIPFRNFIYSLPKDRELLAEEYADFVASVKSLEFLLEDEEDE